jgi:hypothetical protein
VNSIHPLVQCCVDAILVHSGDKKCLGDCIAADNVTVAQVKVDHMITRRADATASLRTTVFCLKDKLVGDVDDALSQVVAYLRRQLRVLVEDWYQRSPMDVMQLLRPDSISHLARLFSVGAGTDGATIRFARVQSAVLDSCTDLGKVNPPMVTFQTAPLPLVPGLGKKYQGGPLQGPLPATPPMGFKVLFALLTAGVDKLTPSSPLLTSVQGVRWPGRVGTADAASGVVGEAGAEVSCVLRDRLGCGGSSDVYNGELLCPGGDGGRPVVVKVPRYATKPVVDLCIAEFNALSDLWALGVPGGGGLAAGEVSAVPLFSQPLHLLVRTGGERGSLQLGQVQYPVLVLDGPLDCEPLPHYLGGVTDADLAGVADKVALRLLQTAQVT